MTISRLPTRAWPTLALLSAASLALAGCGSSEKANVGATADTVELPAEQALAEITAMPSEEPSDLPTIVATDEGMDTSAPAPGASAGLAPVTSPGSGAAND